MVYKGQHYISIKDKSLACFGVGYILHLLWGNIKLLCKDSPVALCLIEHEDKIRVFKDIFYLAACQKVFDILRDSGRYAAPFTETLPNLHTVSGGLFLFQEQMKFVHIVTGRLSSLPG